MSKPTAPSSEYQPPTNGPPSYNQAVSEGAMHQPGAADYKTPQQPGSYGGYGPPPGPAYPQQYGPGPGQQQHQQQHQQQQQYGQYGAPPGMQHQQQQYGQYGPPPGVQVSATVIQTVPPAGPNPTHMVCPHCHAEIDSSVRASPSTTAWVSGLLIALFGCWMGCCLIPCCMDECMDKEHYCPNCKAFLGRYRR